MNCIGAIAANFYGVALVVLFAVALVRSVARLVASQSAKQQGERDETPLVVKIGEAAILVLSGLVLAAIALRCAG
jgi:hypothetical protein